MRGFNPWTPVSVTPMHFFVTGTVICMTIIFSSTIQVLNKQGSVVDK